MNQRRVTDTQPEPRCDDVLDLLYLYVCDELEAEELEVVEAHIKACPSCAEALREHQVLQRALPSGFIDRKLFYYSANN